MLYSVFMPHLILTEAPWVPWDEDILIPPPIPEEETEAWRGEVTHLIPSTWGMEGQGLNPCVPALTSVLALFTSSLPTPCLDPLSCTNLSWLELPGCGALIPHEPIWFFSLWWHSVSVFLCIKREGRKSWFEITANLQGGFLWEKAIRSWCHSNLHFSFHFQPSCHPHSACSSVGFPLCSLKW